LTLTLFARRLLHMKMGYGNGGWVRVDDDEWPGRLYVRLQKDSFGRWRTQDFYWRGDWRHIVGADLRELKLDALEEIINANSEVLEQRSAVVGPDLVTLAESLGVTYGTGAYAGQHCDECDAPLRGGSQLPPRWTGDWVALSWFAQHPGSRIKRPKFGLGKAEERDLTTKVPRLQRPTEGLTVEFLEHVKAAYVQALSQGKRPAPDLARQVGAGTSERTIHKWVAVARKRGIMPPGSRGKAGV
jgi:hypothetical protein